MQTIVFTYYYEHYDVPITVSFSSVSTVTQSQKKNPVSKMYYCYYSLFHQHLLQSALLTYIQKRNTHFYDKSTT